jgi:hypothetical protein
MIVALPRGAHYVSGTAGRRVRLADGRVVTKHAADTLSAEQRYGTGNLRQVRRERQALRREIGRTSDPYTQEVRDALAAGRNRREVEDAALAVRLEAKRHHAAGRRVSQYQDRSPDGPLARYLTSIGRRPVGADYPVGDTP